MYLNSGILFLLGLSTITTAVVIPSSHEQALPLQEWTSFLTKHTKSITQAIICPGGTECPESATCCQMSTGGYGCCPFAEAVCCSDGVHCCPKSTNCDLAEGRCVSQLGAGNFHPMGKKFIWPHALKASGNVRSITCGDKQSECPDSTTCCPLPSGDWGCCPFDSAVCCSDKTHCCPKDTVCNLEEQRCQKHTGTRFSLQKVYAYDNSTSRAVGFGEQDCPDHRQHCADDATCCKIPSGSYGCCPFEKADCCSDGLHCCPEGSKCNIKAGRCE